MFTIYFPPLYDKLKYSILSSVLWYSLFSSLKPQREAIPFSIHIPVTCKLQLAAFLMKFSDQSETNQAGYEEASNTRMSSWLINESYTPGAGLEPGSGPGTLEES